MLALALTIPTPRNTKPPIVCSMNPSILSFWQRQCLHHLTKWLNPSVRNFISAMPRSLSSSSRNTQASPLPNTASGCRPKGNYLRSWLCFGSAWQASFLCSRFVQGWPLTLRFSLLLYLGKHPMLAEAVLSLLFLLCPISLRYNLARGIANLIRSFLWNSRLLISANKVTFVTPSLLWIISCQDWCLVVLWSN